MTRVTARYVDNWKFWMTAFGFGLAVVFILLFVGYRRQNQEETSRANDARVAAEARIAQVRSANNAEVAQCFSNAQRAPIISGFIQSQYALVDNSTQSTTDALAHTSADDPLYKVRLRSLNRLAKARVNLDKLAGVVLSQTATEDKCIALAKKLQIPYKEFIRQADVPAKVTTKGRK